MCNLSDTVGGIGSCNVCKLSDTVAEFRNCNMYGPPDIVEDLVFAGHITRLSDIFFYWRRAPQQMLRTHRSLKASCATL
jgi:hypothetical protein